MLEILLTPTKEELSNLKNFLNTKFEYKFSDEETLESYFSLVHLGKALHIFAKQHEVANGKPP